jgi:hypothetical protein
MTAHALPETGLYKTILDGATVHIFDKDWNLLSKGALNNGDIAYITEVKEFPEESIIRGQIRVTQNGKEEKGWVSIQNTQNVHRFKQWMQPRGVCKKDWSPDNPGLLAVDGKETSINFFAKPIKSSGMCIYHAPEMQADSAIELKKKGLQFATGPGKSPEYGFHISDIRERPQESHATVRYELTPSIKYNKNPIVHKSCSKQVVSAYLKNVKKDPQEFYMLVQDPEKRAYRDEVCVEHVRKLDKEKTGCVTLSEYRDNVYNHLQELHPNAERVHEKFKLCVVNIEKLITKDLLKIKNTLGQHIMKTWETKKKKAPPLYVKVDKENTKAKYMSKQNKQIERANSFHKY